jgi:hypothetical protein
LSYINPLARGFPVRTREVDTLRLVNPWQWIKCDWDFRNIPKGDYLGAVNFSWSGQGECIPHNDDIHVRWKSQAGTAAVAEWNWTFWYPREQYLKDLWWDPFMMLEREVTW